MDESNKKQRRFEFYRDLPTGVLDPIGLAEKRFMEMETYLQKLNDQKYELLLTMNAGKPNVTRQSDDRSKLDFLNKKIKQTEKARDLYEVKSVNLRPCASKEEKEELIDMYKYNYNESPDLKEENPEEVEPPTKEELERALVAIEERKRMAEKQEEMIMKKLRLLVKE